MYDVIIVGGGPAGLTAALYAQRAGKTAVVLEKDAFGGQITWSPRVENYPAVAAMSGVEFADRLVEQVLAQGAVLEPEEAAALSLNGDIAVVTTVSGSAFEGRAVINATGAKPRRLGLDNEESLIGAGVSFCAVCDGAFYKGRSVAVAGGGNAALQDALFLSELCNHVYVIHRRDAFRGEAALAKALAAKRNVELLLSSRVSALHGTETLTGITVTDEQNGSRLLAVEGLFVAVGHEPQNGLFSPYISLDDAGYAEADEQGLTKTPLIFTAGDCRKKTVRQLTTAVGDGAAAATAACRYLEAL